jgi:RHS repeat-associated protein
MLLDNQGNVVNNITYDAFGNITLETNSNVNFRFSYTGRELDAETGLYNYRSRYYDPESGEFISEDRIGFAGGDSNLSRYVSNSPVNQIDPFGYSGFCSVGPSGEPEFFGPAFGPDSNPGGKGINVGLDYFFGKPAEALMLDEALKNRNSSEENRKTTDIESDRWWYEQERKIEVGLDKVWDFFRGTGERVKEQLDLRSLFEQQQRGENNGADWVNKFLKGENFDPNINIGTYTPKVDPFGNVERFPRNPDDFLKGDTFTFPGSGNIKVKDYIETFPKGVDYWLESPFFDYDLNEDQDYVNLKKQLASDEQLGESGTTIIGRPRDQRILDVAPRLTQEYGGNPEDWVKKSSTSYKPADGSHVETHWYENIETGQRVEYKTKIKP